MRRWVARVRLRWQVRRDDRLLDRLAAGRPARRRDRLTRLLEAWRDESRPDEE